MDFLNKFTGKDEKPTSDHPKDTATDHPKDTAADHPKPSNSDLLGSAKVIAAAAKEGKFQDPRVAGAAADILDAGEKYGKLDETKGVGQYVEKAEDYLRQYGSTHSTTAPVKPDEKPAEPAKKSESESGGGDFMKMAGGFLKKD